VSSTATLAYEITAAPTVPVANLAAAVAAVALSFTAIETVTGCTLASDTTTTLGQVVTRTIVFDINTAQFIAQFPAGTDQACPFRDLYTHELAHFLNTKVAPQPVVIA